MLLTIDPGLGGTGWALFNDNSLTPEKTGVINSDHELNSFHWAIRARSIIDQIDDLVSKTTDYKLLENYKTSKVYIELPTFFSTTKGATTATGKEGDDSDLVKLSVLVGMLTQLFQDMNLEVEFIRVNDWKGTLPKKVVCKRIGKRLDCAPNKFGNHAADAVGMGLYVKGVFKANAMQETSIKPLPRTKTETGKTSGIGSPSHHKTTWPNNRS